MTENIHLIFTYPERFSQEIIDTDKLEIQEKNLNIHIKEHKSEFMQF